MPAVRQALQQWLTQVPRSPHCAYLLLTLTCAPPTLCMPAPHLIPVLLSTQATSQYSAALSCRRGMLRSAPCVAAWLPLAPLCCRCSHTSSLSLSAGGTCLEELDTAPALPLALRTRPVSHTLQALPRLTPTPAQTCLAAPFHSLTTCVLIPCCAGWLPSSALALSPLSGLSGCPRCAGRCSSG